MNAIQCELCGGTDIVKDGDFFVCKNCGMKYTLEAAKKMMIEGVVQVEGEVSINNETAIMNNLELARSSLMAANFERAEKYADDVIALDQKNVDAWFIKAKSTLGQTSIANDRVFEMMVCSKSVIDIIKDRVRARPSAVTVHELELLGEVSDLIVKGTTGICKLYGNAFTPHSSSDIGGMIVNSLPTTLETASNTLELLKACFRGRQDLEIFIATYEGEGKNEREAWSLWEKLNNASYRVGEIRYLCTKIINSSVVAAYQEENSRYEKNRVFTYYISGGPTPDTTDEQTYLTNHQTTLKNYVTLTQSAEDLWVDESTFRYAYSSDEEEAWSSYLDTLHENMSTYINDLKTHTTLQRVISQYSSGNVPGVGYSPTEEYIEKLDKELALRDKMRAAGQANGKLWKLANARETKETAELWWNEHDDLKARLDAFREDTYQELISQQNSLKQIEEQISSVIEANKSEHPVQADVQKLENDVADLSSQIENLSVFKRKERARLKNELSQKQVDLSKAKQQLENELEIEQNKIKKETAKLNQQKKDLETRLADLQNVISSVYEMLRRIPEQNVIDLLASGKVADIFSGNRRSS